MSLDEDKKNDSRGAGKSKHRIKYHYTVDGEKRYCTNYPKGKDELIHSWYDVNCKRCHEERELRKINKKLFDKLKEEMKRE